jgi:type III pantothenate kinase
MLLAIDIGNTNTVFAVYEGESLRQEWRAQSAAKRTGDEYAAFLKELMALAGLAWADLTDVIISSVVPDANFNIKTFCQKFLNVEPLFVDKNTVGIEIDIDRPQDVGADRLVNAVAVVAHYRVPAIVIDFGTATTFDVIDAKGRYAGGAIAPGINLSVSALHQAAAQLPSITIQKPARAIGKNTIEAMQSGIYLGYISLIEGMVAQIKNEMGVEPFVLATGGLAPLFANDTAVINAVDDQLTLKGLLHLYQSRKK